MVKPRWVGLVPWVLAAVCCVPAVAVAAPGCPPPDWPQSRLEALKAERFTLADGQARQTLALALLPCLADPDPVVRDGIAFEAWSNWLRADALDRPTRLQAFRQLLPVLAASSSDREGFRQPFSALVLSELARADRKQAYLSDAQRRALVEAGAGYLESVRDYRGFDSRQGWRHGVAHGADLLMQLALNPAVDAAQLERIAAAVASQVAPAGEHAYIHGEPERLARPLLFAVQRGLVPADYWKRWFQRIAAPAPLPSWDQAYRSAAGLARRHNTRAFLLLVYSEVRDSKDASLAALTPAVTAALASVP
jgi:hypothetical protein